MNYELKIKHSKQKIQKGLYLSKNNRMKIIRIALLLFITSPLFSQTIIESDPFLKWKCVSKGLSYSSIEIKLEEGTLLSNRVDKISEISIRANKPTGFTEIDGNVFFGIGLTMINLDADTILFTSEDLYAEQDVDITPDMLTNLSVDFTPTIDAKNILLKIRFFDKKGTSEILLECPFELVDHSDATMNSNNYLKWFADPSYCLNGQSVEIDGSFLTKSKAPLTSLDFQKSEPLGIQINTVNFKSTKYNYSYTWIDSKGATVYSEKKSLQNSWNGKLTFELPKILSPQPYLLTFGVEGETGKIGFSQWFFIKEEKEMTSDQKKQFGNLFTEIALQKLNAEQTRYSDIILSNAEYYSPKSLSILEAKGQISMTKEEYDKAIKVTRLQVLSLPIQSLYFKN